MPDSLAPREGREGGSTNRRARTEQQTPTKTINYDTPPTPSDPPSSTAGTMVLRRMVKPARMPDGLNKIHKNWAGRHRVNGLIVETISPYQQKVWAGLFKNFGSKTIHRFTDNWFTAGVPGCIALGIYFWAPIEHDRLTRLTWP